MFRRSRLRIGASLSRGDGPANLGQQTNGLDA